MMAESIKIGEWPKVYVIVLNWNGWKDTIECLESLYKMSYPNYQIVVVDNGSTDDSVEKIKSWAEGNVLAEAVSEDERIKRLVSPPVPKPVPLTLIETKTNLGYAGGNNVGLRYALDRGDFGYAWVLNNDTVVHSDALKQMVCRMRDKPGAGLCGSVTLNYNDPEKKAMLGVRYDRWFAQPSPIEVGGPFDLNQREKYLKHERKISYIAGSSMLVSYDFLCNIGLMCEDYFLYFEEIDWALRARGLFSLALAPESIVYHKGSVSIKKKEGERANKKSFSLVHDYYIAKNRVLFTLKFYPYAMPILYLSIVGYILDRVRVGAWENAWIITKVIYVHFYSDLIIPFAKWGRTLLKIDPGAKKGGEKN